jgi:AdoMet-dependent heme synthase
MSVEGPDIAPSTNLYEELVAKSQEQHRLLSAHWELTYRCNARCSHCYVDVAAPNAKIRDELDTAECISLLDQLAELGALNITFSGGEALVRRDFFEIARYARTKQFLVRLFTNGIRITPSVADQIAALHPYVVEISVYSPHAETHDTITGVSRSHELAVRALRLLHERGIRTVAKTPLMRENIRDYDRLQAQAEELGAQFQYDITITADDRGQLRPLEHRITYDDLVGLFRKTLEPSMWTKRSVPLEQRTCNIALNALVIDPFGNIYPCVQLRKRIGNTRTQALKTIWEESPLWHELGHLTVGALPVCRTCELKTLCVRCHGIAQLEDHDLRGPAVVNCVEAMARRQVLVERGAQPDDYPIPEHLRLFSATEDRLRWIDVDDSSLRV